MRFLILAAAALSLATPALAETAATAKYTSADTELGVLLDNPAAKAIVEKYIPGMTSNDQVDMARAEIEQRPGGQRRHCHDGCAGQREHRVLEVGPQLQPRRTP